MDQEEKEIKEPTKEEVMDKINILKELLNSVMGGMNVSSRIDPILKPDNIRTTSFVTKGEVNMCMSLLTFAQIAPIETIPCVEFIEQFLSLKLSEGGFAITKAIELGRALTQKSATQTSFYTPERPTQDMKEKEK